jgi:hypothetical protein
MLRCISLPFFTDVAQEILSKKIKRACACFVLLLSANQGYLPAFLQAGNHYEWLAHNFYQKAADGGNRQAKNQVRMFDRMYCGPPLDLDDDDDDDDDDYDGVDWTDGDGDDDDSEDENDA